MARNGLLRIWSRRLGAALLVFAAVLAAAVVVASLTTERSYWARILVWNEARFDDYATKFPARPIANGPDVFRLQPPANAKPPEALKTVAFTRNGREETAPLEALLASSGTTAFLVVKGDRLLYEGYFNGADRSSLQTSFSVAKSFASALVGAAIADGLMGGVDDPIVKYLPELAGRPGLDRIRIRHLLAMASGLRYNGSGANGGPFSDDARIYYDPDLRALALRVQAETPPGSQWQYDNFHPLLLGMILERATAAKCRTISRKSYGGRSAWRRRARGASTAATTGLRRWRAGSTRGRSISPSSAFCTCVAASGRAGRFCRKAGSKPRPGTTRRSPDPQPHPSPATGCGGSTTVISGGSTRK
jgi:hypothetical protein